VSRLRCPKKKKNYSPVSPTRSTSYTLNHTIKLNDTDRPKMNNQDQIALSSNASHCTIVCLQAFVNIWSVLNLINTNYTFSKLRSSQFQIYYPFPSNKIIYIYIYILKFFWVHFLMKFPPKYVGGIVLDFPQSKNCIVSPLQSSQVKQNQCLQGS
jgi:hypothetical protein